MTSIKETPIEEMNFFIESIMSYKRIQNGIKEKKEKVSFHSVPEDNKVYTIEEIFGKED